MDVPKVPPCQRCGRDLDLARVLDGVDDHPTTFVFKCPACERYALYYRDSKGDLRQR